jgi:hypothetical protein
VWSVAITEEQLVKRAARTSAIWRLVYAARNWWTWRTRGYRQARPVMVSFDGEPAWPLMITTIRPGSLLDLPDDDEEEDIEYEPYELEDWVEASAN